ncbi:hypothetical protein LX36DRAFT_79944 [Colletotrichum falcatum]|nr:hypothetical protein LX36DRAFT_79944 [Colletotrichum falcatum]
MVEDLPRHPGKSHFPRDWRFKAMTMACLLSHYSMLAFTSPPFLSCGSVPSPRWSPPGHYTFMQSRLIDQALESCVVWGKGGERKQSMAATTDERRVTTAAGPRTGAWRRPSGSQPNGSCRWNEEEEKGRLCFNPPSQIPLCFFSCLGRRQWRRQVFFLVTCTADDELTWQHILRLFLDCCRGGDDVYVGAHARIPRRRRCISKQQTGGSDQSHMAGSTARKET